MRLVRQLFLSASFSFANVAGIFAAGLLVASVPVCTAWAGPPGTLGTITITEKKIETSVVNSPKELKAAAVSSLTKGKEDDGWKVYFVAHMNRAPGAEEVNIAFYDQSPKPGQPREAVNFYPMRTKKDGKIMMAEIEIKPEDGFKVGGKYNVLLTRLINGKEEVYARTTVELK